METKTSDRWQSYLSAALAATGDDPTARFAQLATVGANGTPFNRTVVVREFDAETGDLWIVTDERSQKVVQIRADSSVALCWYLAATRQQFRFRAAATLVDAAVEVDADQRARRSAWAALSSRTRRQFVWPKPRAPREPDDNFEGEVPHDPPGTFVLVEIHPAFVDHLDLSTTLHRRVLYALNADGAWTRQPVNP